MDSTRGYNDLPLMLTVAEVSAVMRVGRGMVYALVRTGELPSKKIGARGMIRISKDDLFRYMAGEINFPA